eukprot:12411593-Karenia_brevis.AAC.1
MMLKDVPKRIVTLANPLHATAKFEGGGLVDKNPNMNLGAEHIGTKQVVYDLTTVPPETAMTDEKCSKFTK